MPRKPVRCWLISDEVATMLNVTTSRIVSMNRQGFFPNAECTSTGTWMFYLKDVEKVIAERAKTPPKAGRKKSPTKNSRVREASKSKVSAKEKTPSKTAQKAPKSE